MSCGPFNYQRLIPWFEMLEFTCRLVNQIACEYRESHTYKIKASNTTMIEKAHADWKLCGTFSLPGVCIFILCCRLSVHEIITPIINYPPGAVLWSCAISDCQTLAHQSYGLYTRGNMIFQEELPWMNDRAIFEYITIFQLNASCNLPKAQPYLYGGM